MSSSTFGSSVSKLRGGLIEMPKKVGGEFIFIPFIFNPTTFEEEESDSYTVTTVPGWADPHVMYVGGQASKLKFEMILEQQRMVEMFRKANSNVQLAGLIGNNEGKDKIIHRSFPNISSNPKKGAKSTIDFAERVDMYIERIKMIKRPARTGKAGQLFENAPARVMVVLGPHFSKIGHIDKIGTKYEEFYRDGTLKSATMSISMILTFGHSNQPGRFRNLAEEKKKRQVSSGASS